MSDEFIPSFHFELQQDVQWNPLNPVLSGRQNNKVTDWLNFCAAIITQDSVNLKHQCKLQQRYPKLLKHTKYK